jgi:predicted secreted Zn-dependent protease
MRTRGTTWPPLVCLVSISALALSGCAASAAAGASVQGSRESPSAATGSADVRDSVPHSHVATPDEWQALATDSRVTLHLTVHRYMVQGSTPRELMRSMARTGPASIGSRRAIGGFQLTKGDLGFWLRPGRRCSVTDARLSVEAGIWVPGWPGATSAPARIRTWWHRVARDIWQHEQEHAFIALTELRAVPALLDSVAGHHGCHAVGAEVRRLLDERWRAAERRNRAFDRWTHNGTTGPYWLG